MSECLNCGKPIEAYTGRRTRKYCSPACKQAHFKKTKPKEAKYIQVKTFEAVIKEKDERIKSLEAILAQNRSNGVEVSKSEETQNLNDKKKPDEQIKHKTDVEKKIQEILNTIRPKTMSGPQFATWQRKQIEAAKSNLSSTK